MRWSSRLLVVFILCLIAVALPSLPAQALCDKPVIELLPGSGVPGTQLIVRGKRFETGKYIDMYYEGTIVSQGTKTSPTGDFSVGFPIPETCKGAHEVLVEVGSDGGTVRLETSFYATPGLTVAPARGPDRTTVTVTGHGFAKNEDGIEVMYYTGEDTYYRVAKDIEANASGYWQTTFETPDSERGEHKIDARGSISQTYDVKDATFQVIATITIDKSSGTTGESIAMTGTEFAPYEKGIQILFDGQPVATGIKADGQGGWEEAFDVPGMASGNYSVTAEGEYTLQQDLIGLSFEIKPYMLLSPDEGYVGMNVTVTGYGFAADEYVSIMYDTRQEATALTDRQGDFEASFSVPSSQHGEHKVTIGYSPGSIASATFTLESDPPDKPQLLSPSDGTRVGLKGGVTPTFEWSPVTDDSGVSYNFQIAASPDVTSAGEFTEPMISASGLTGTSFTVMEALPQGKYYWIVQAVDGAQNQGGWTPPGVFKVGLMPLWAFIVIIVAIVALFVALIRALVRRRRYYW